LTSAFKHGAVGNPDDVFDGVSGQAELLRGECNAPGEDRDFPPLRIVAPEQRIDRPALIALTVEGREA